MLNQRLRLIPSSLEEVLEEVLDVREAMAAVMDVVMEAMVEDMVDMEATEDMEVMALKEVGDMVAEKLFKEKGSRAMALTIFVQIFLIVAINLKVLSMFNITYFNF